MKPSEQFSRRRICILIPSLAGRGAERKALHVATGLIERGHEVDLLLQRLVCHYPDEVPDGVRIFFQSRRTDGKTRKNLDRIPVVPSPLVPGLPPRRVRYPRMALALRLHRTQLPLLTSTRLPRWAAEVAAYLDRERPDALLAMNVLAAAAATMALNFARRPARVVATLDEVLKTGRLRYRARHAYPHVDAVVGVSHGVATEFEKVPGLERARIHTIYNPVVSAHLVHGARQPANHPWLDESGAPVILAVGKLVKGKDYPTLLIAFARLLGQRPARLIVLGEGRLRSRLLSLARKLRIVEHVDFPGYKENPYAFFAKADLFVLSSRNEGLSNVLIEAMACGCPVVSTDCDFGPHEILEGGRYGALVPVGDPAALSAAMARTLDVSVSRDVLRERASFFDAENAVRQYERLLLGACAVEYVVTTGEGEPMESSDGNDVRRRHGRAPDGDGG